MAWASRTKFTGCYLHNLRKVSKIIPLAHPEDFYGSFGELLRQENRQT